MSRVELRDIRKTFGRIEVLHGIDLTIEQSEFIALVGPSGCGKSTLLRVISGLETISSGEVVFDGRVVNALDPKHRNVAMVFQNYALYPHMTVRENMSLNLRLSKKPKAEIEERVSAAAKLLDIENVMDRRPAQLSGGQRQRVAMGRAIVRNPEVFLFDEPLSNLDAKLRVMMRAEIKALHQKVQTTAIYVTHDQIEAMTLADRIAVMNSGRIEQVGSPVDLYHSPTNRFVAGFIGSPAMNFLAGHVESGAAKLNGADGRLPHVPVDGLPEGASIEIGIRPEHLSLSEDDTGLPATIGHVDPTGSQTHIVANVFGQDVTVVLAGMMLFSPGDQIRLSVAADNIYLFAQDDGRAVGVRPAPPSMKVPHQ